MHWAYLQVSASLLAGRRSRQQVSSSRYVTNLTSKADRLEGVLQTQQHVLQQLASHLGNGPSPVAQHSSPSAHSQHVPSVETALYMPTPTMYPSTQSNSARYVHYGSPGVFSTIANWSTLSMDCYDCFDRQILSRDARKLRRMMRDELTMSSDVADMVGCRLAT